ncbi:hypothetical protein TorRG33x02_312900 [Trema orientale]|uniref:Transmembrane protein n=1 Tax=Trema orientale TaxID=63057 RepID=A0A2P5BQ66_TREOI|nr:hypothetical protein TorRG33x02_312900 [Trema orientale]
MRLSRLALLLVILFFYLVFPEHWKMEANSTTELVMGSGNSLNVGRAKCGKKRAVECQKSSDQENVFEDEDYIYTNSLP